MATESPHELSLYDAIQAMARAHHVDAGNQAPLRITMPDPALQAFARHLGKAIPRGDFDAQILTAFDLGYMFFLGVCFATPDAPDPAYPLIFHSDIRAAVEDILAG